MLVEARAAIAARNFARANALVEQAEAAQPKYSLFHLGPTPALVRRELSEGPEGRRRGAGIVDLRVARREFDDPRTRCRCSNPPIRLPRGWRGAALGVGGKPISVAGRCAIEVVAPPVVPALHSSSGRRGRRVRRPCRDSRNRTIRRAVVANLCRPGTFPRSESPSQYARSPDACRLRRHEFERTRRQIQRPRPCNCLRKARQALAAGDFAQAEESARLATAIGVPESAFLPNEDRPSMLAWEIQQARITMPGAAAGWQASAE